MLLLFSGATYLKYRAAAWQSFQSDLQTNLDALQGGLLEEIRELPQPPPGVARREPDADAVRHAAAQALNEFRLNGLYAEIRGGRAAERLLARLPAADDAPVQASLTPAVWSEVARSRGTRSIPLAEGWHAAARSLRAEGLSEPVVLLVAGPSAQVEETLGAIRLAMLGFGSAGLLIAVGVGYWMATRALRPIDSMTRQAARMAQASPATTPHRLDVRNAEDELGRLALTFNLLLERIESSMARTKAFVAEAAHELKTPVSIVRTESELALAGTRSPEQYREALTAIALESQRLSGLVSDVMLLAEGELLEQPLERRLVDVYEIVQDVGHSLGSVATGRGIRISTDGRPGFELHGDERLLRRVAVNLLENAVKFSPAGACVDVRLTREAGRIVLRVLDEGPSLSEGERERVFERFYRSERSRSEGIPGSGLGLAVVRWAAALHGGSARAEPRLPRGNVFVVELPATAPALRDAGARYSGS